MSKYNQLVYWDAAVFIVLLTDDPGYKHGQKEGIRACLNGIQAHKIYMITSDAVQLEVLPGKMLAAAEEKFQKMFGHPCIARKHPHARIMSLARELRDYYARERALMGRNKMLGSMDSIHLATAIHYKVDAFYTFDHGGKRDISLLKLDGNVAGHNLHICEPPEPKQTSMDLGH